MSVALVQEFKIFGGDRSAERGEQPDLESMYELHHCVRGH